MYPGSDVPVPGYPGTTPGIRVFDVIGLQTGAKFKKKKLLVPLLKSQLFTAKTAHTVCQCHSKNCPHSLSVSLVFTNTWYTCTGGPGYRGTRVPGYRVPEYPGTPGEYVTVPLPGPGHRLTIITCAKVSFTGNKAHPRPRGSNNWN